MNFRGDRRINEGERGGWGEWIGPCNNSRTVRVTSGMQLMLWVLRYAEIEISG